MITDLKIAGIVLVLLYVAVHVRHYRRHRRAGFGVFYSLRGPWGTRVTVRKRLRPGRLLLGAAAVVAVVFAAGLVLGGHL
jgi:hypothetical protein